MSRIDYYGSIPTDDPDLVARVLGGWLGTGPLTVRIKMLGPEMLYERDDDYLYAYSASGDAPTSFLMNGNMTDTPDRAVERLRTMLRLFEAEGVRCSLDYEVDEGDVIMLA